MSVRESLNQVLETLPEDRLSQVRDFAEFLNWQQERQDWKRFGQTQLARAYGPDEPEYSETDLKVELNP
ncbi:MAG: hypothetical protein HY000_01435 [Planctomycetes bacterium]|nr:hypothetical protein [Planctomycetota bacterium]